MAQTATYEPFHVTAVAPFGIAFGAPWGIALDGLLAGIMWSEQKSTWRQSPQYMRVREVESPPDLDLPLARCGSEDLWHWAATCSYIADAHLETRSRFGRFDARSLEQTTRALPMHLSPTQGRYRTRIVPVVATLGPKIHWSGVGDIEAIERLLAGVTHIGKKRASGEGLITQWSVDNTPHIDSHDAGHLHPDGSLGRPVPEMCLKDYQPRPTHHGPHKAGLRPPYTHAARQCTLYTPPLPTHH